MSATELAGILLGLAAIGGLGLSVVTFVATRRSNRDATAITKAVASVEERHAEFEIMDGTVKTLRQNLVDAQVETNQLRADLTAARRDTRKLQEEVTVALANVAVLSEHIREHVPVDVPFPRLRKVSNGF